MAVILVSALLVNHAKYCFILFNQAKDYYELVYVIVFDARKFTSAVVDTGKPIYIMHAGGGIRNLTYTNSLEALDQNYAFGERAFELDFDITSDEEVVSIHGWEQMDLYETGVPGKQYSLAEFSAMRRKDSLSQITLNSLAMWLQTHPGSNIITDVKSDNVKALRIIAAQYPQLKGRFIPQIYHLKEYAPVRSIGFEKIILTLYVKEYGDSIVMYFAGKFPLYAVTMWDSRVLRGKLAKRLASKKITVYAHTVNDLAQVEILRTAGAFGVYTDFLRTIRPVRSYLPTHFLPDETLESML
jgi:glycerophosphoryl diester phosphodiesterase